MKIPDTLSDLLGFGLVRNVLDCILFFFTVYALRGYVFEAVTKTAPMVKRKLAPNLTA